MPSTLAKNLSLNLCFSKIKRPPSISAMPDDHRRPFPSSSTTTSSILYKNFNSLYDEQPVDATPNSFDSESEPDFATVFASQRFFFTSPGRSNSIIESTPSFSTNGSDQSASTNGSDQSASTNSSHQRFGGSLTVKDSVAVPTFSPDPFTDFRRSMQEMAEAHELLDVKSDWECLHELLMSYLALNPESLHKYIIGAFADLLVSLMSADGNRRSPAVAGEMLPGNACE